MQPLVVLNTVGLTARHLPLAPRLCALAQRGWQRSMREVLPAVTCTAQATILTGKLPRDHGIVGNGWLYRDTMEVRFWQQSNRLIQSEPVYATARRLARERGRRFRCAKLFWWFNQGAAVDISVTPKPHYGADGNKAFDILSTPPELADRLKQKIGPFPFATFWGPMAGLASSQWIAQCAAEVLKDAEGPPDLTLVYLPHLDYDTQRFGPAHCDWSKLVSDLDSACSPILQTAQEIGARVWVVNEYAHVQVDQPIYVNQALRRADLLAVRSGPFGEQLDTFRGAFAVCDHQLAHVYLQDQALLPKTRAALSDLAGIDRVVAGEAKAEIGLDHARAGDLIAIAKPNAWFAYPYWLDDALAPDFARTVDIHRKPAYDPCELFFNPELTWPKGRAIRKLAAKKLGFRMLLDVVPLDAHLVRGSHGLRAVNADDRPVFIGDGPAPSLELDHTEIAELILGTLSLK
jgi:hypothetical protein